MSCCRTSPATTSAGAIKTNPRTQHTPVVCVTALNDPLDILQGLECGAENFITKPFDANYLVRRIRGILANKSRRAGQPREPGVTLSFRGKGVTITTDKEQILDLLLATLEEFVRTRAREREMRDAQAVLARRFDELAEVDQRKDHFLAMLAHELRNPLTPLLNGLHVLRQGELDRQAQEASLTMMERQVRHLSRLLDDLLDVARIRRGLTPVRLERTDLSRLVRTTAQDRCGTLAQAGLGLTVEAPETPLWAKGDATRLTQILNNLLDNAAKFTPAGGRVGVQLAVDEDRQQAVVTIRDSGVGIEPEVLSRLFDVFVQADQSLERSRGGLGLGLAVVKGLVELHGGEVGAASEGPGRGAEFTVRLPLEHEPAALAQASRTPPPAGESLKVVVIEDNQDSAETLRLLLETMGHEVRVAYSGSQGIELACAWEPAVVISDIGLPGLDGYEVAVALRRNPVTARARLIALTGYGAEEDRHAAGKRASTST